jgi:pyruvate,water dikinase
VEEKMKTDYVLELAHSTAGLEEVGGKGLSLAKMLNARFPVPNGFHITTEAYRRFVTANGLQPGILAALRDVGAALPASLESASATIAGLFAAASIPVELAAAITGAYAGLSGDQSGAVERKPVAVRSSATAEDLPEASFAGQQDSFLNICGHEALLEAVKKCWASLWTARAIAYRVKNNIDQESVALAVIVQQMVDAEASGVLFTANPVNGHRDEVVINAAWGLGEAIVGGLVSPDTIIADKATGKVRKMDVSEKSVITVKTDRGTRLEPLIDARRRSSVMNAEQIGKLVDLARKIENFQGAPQDIEWCRAGGEFYILQSRPITVLPEPELPLPAQWKLPRGAYAAMRNNIVELMVEPLTPLFGTLGLSAVNSSLNRFMDESFGMRGIMPAEIILVVNQYAYNNGSVSAKGMARLLFGAGKILKKMFTGAVERWTESGHPRYRQLVESWQARDWRSFSSIELVDTAKLLTGAAIDAYGALVSGVIPAAWITEALFTALYGRLIKRRGDPSAPTLLLGYDSLPIQADKELYNLAQWAHEQAALAEYLESTPTRRLVAALDEGHAAPAPLSPAVWNEWRQRMHGHLQKFGHTLYDLDFAHPVPADDPAPVLDTFKLYLGGRGADPSARQRESVERREQAVSEIRSRLRGLRLKWFNRYLALARRYAPLREDGLAEIGLAYPLLRQMLRETGARLVEQRIIPTADDVFWLTEAELRSAAARLDAGQAVETLSEKIACRKADYSAAMRLSPPPALPQMKVFGFDLMSLKARGKRAGKGNTIRGVAASPGKVTGTARVLHGPGDFARMLPGDILVAPVTTPAWTPLFAMASAIVTDVGGPLSHGSIVAREYGIPAVLGTGTATRRIRDGQTITVDGGAGLVLLDSG